MARKKKVWPPKWQVTFYYNGATFGPKPETYVTKKRAIEQARKARNNVYDAWRKRLSVKKKNVDRQTFRLVDAQGTTQFQAKVKPL